MRAFERHAESAAGAARASPALAYATGVGPRLVAVIRLTN